MFTEDEERKIQKAVASLKNLFGQRPLGGITTKLVQILDAF